MAAGYLVTGGAGFIGSHLARQLLEEGAAVRILDNFSTGKRATVEALAARYPQLEVIEGDVADPEACRAGVTGCRYVFHQAALASVPRSLDDPLGTHRSNATGTLQLLAEARAAGVGRFVYAGSSSVYGDVAELPKVESMRPAPLSPYALSKFMGEEYARLFHDHFGLETVTLRYFNVFGAGQDPDSAYAAVIPSFLKRLLRGERPVIYGDGHQSRDFTHVTNVVRGNLAACHAPQARGAYNIACGERTSLLELLAALQSMLGTDLAPVHEPLRSGDVAHSQADISRARRELDYAPTTGLEEGLRGTVAYFRELFAS